MQAKWENEKKKKKKKAPLTIHHLLMHIKHRRGHDESDENSLNKVQRKQVRLRALHLPSHLSLLAPVWRPGTEGEGGKVKLTGGEKESKRGEGERRRVKVSGGEGKGEGEFV